MLGFSKNNNLLLSFLSTYELIQQSINLAEHIQFGSGTIVVQYQLVEKIIRRGVLANLSKKLAESKLARIFRS